MRRQKGVASVASRPGVRGKAEQADEGAGGAGEVPGGRPYGIRGGLPSIGHLESREAEGERFRRPASQRGPPQGESASCEQLGAEAPCGGGAFGERVQERQQGAGIEGVGARRSRNAEGTIPLVRGPEGGGSGHPAQRIPRNGSERPASAAQTRQQPAHAILRQPLDQELRESCTCLPVRRRKGRDAVTEMDREVGLEHGGEEVFVPFAGVRRHDRDVAGRGFPGRDQAPRPPQRRDRFGSRIGADDDAGFRRGHRKVGMETSFDPVPGRAAAPATTR